MQMQSLLIVLILACQFMACKQAQASAMSEVAASMKAKQWKPVMTQGLQYSWINTDCCQNTFFIYSTNAEWDPISRQLLYLGAGNDGPWKFVVYSESDNTWRNPASPTDAWGSATEVTTHQYHKNYGNLALDSSGNFYCFHTDSVIKFNTRQNAWVKALPSYGSSRFGSFEYFPELNGLVYVVNGTVTFYDFGTSQWSTLATGLSMNTWCNVAKYNPVYKEVVFGAGGTFHNMYRLDTLKRITAFADVPFNLDCTENLFTVDPVSGMYLLLTADSIYQYDKTADKWSGASKNPIPAILTPRKIVAAPCATYGVVAFFSASASYPLLLYKHTAGSDAVEQADAKSASPLVLDLTPNPFQGTLRICGSLPPGEAHTAWVSIFDVIGKQVFKRSVSSHELAMGIRWDAQRLPRGLYVVQLKAGAGQVGRKALLH